MVLLLIVLLCGVSPVFCQEQATTAACYSAGSVAGAAIGAFVVALLLVALAYYLRRLYSKRQRGKHLVLTTDPQSVKDEFAFDNPGFRAEKSALFPGQTEKPALVPAAFAAERIPPRLTQDDSYLHRPSRRRVRLWARDFTGLGFRCGGGARDGVLVHSVLKSGPAAAADVRTGDRIKSIKIELTGTTLEDAVGILSLASPYPVELELESTVGGSGGGGGGVPLVHPLRRRTASQTEISTLERERHQRPQSPKQHSQHSTLESKHSRGIKKAITDKLITNTLEKKRKDDQNTLERENEKNTKMANRSSLSDITDMNVAEKVKIRHSTGTPYHENGNIEHAELQKKENNKRGMKFGIRVLPPNVPDDRVLSKQNSVENGEVKTIDEPDKPKPAVITQITHENEVEVKKPVVAKRREKVAPPIPNARTVSVNNDSSLNSSLDSSRKSEPTFTTFARNDNNSGLKRDKNGIPLELPSHMLEAAISARNNRKSSADLIVDDKKDSKKEDVAKPAKKSKGKAPSPPAQHADKNKTDDSIIEQMKNIHDFLKNEKEHSSLLHDSSIMSTDNSGISYTSTPKINKTKPKSQEIDETMSFSQDDIDDIVSKPFKKEIEPNSSMHNLQGVTMYHSGKSDKGSTTIELNYSDITVHSSPNDTIQSGSDEASMLDENERKAASLGDLSRFALRNKHNKTTMSTLERAQSLDISTEDPEIPDSTLSPKKKKAYSVVETTFFDSTTKDVLPDVDAEKRVTINQAKEPRLSLNIAKTSAIEGLNTFQRNRLKKGSEFGNLEDAIVKGSSSSIDSDKVDSQRSSTVNLSKDMDEENHSHETSDDLARKILDENMKVHLKLVSDFAKTTSDGSELSSLDSTWEKPPTPPSSELIPKEDKRSIKYDTNIPDDMKVSSNNYVNSLERPKSEMMKKLLAINPLFNKDKSEEKSHETVTTITDSKKVIHQPDIVKFDVKSTDQKPTEYDDFISNIRVGSANNSLKKSHKIQDYVREYETSPLTKSYTKSIEIGESTGKFIPDVIDGIKRRTDEKDGRVVYMEPPNVVIKMTEEPVQKTVTVNVAEDKFGNKVITQNVENFSTKHITATSEAPLEVEQISFGIMKSTDDINNLNLEEGNVKDIDRSILEKIRRQNPNMHFSSNEPAYTKTETIILNTELDEDQAMALMDKIKNDPSFMTQKTPEELSKLGIRIIRDLEDLRHEDHDVVEVTKTRYSINPSIISESKTCEPDSLNHKIHDNVTKTDIRGKVDKISSRQRQPIDEPVPSYELDKEMLNDFITNERHHSGRQHGEVLKRTKSQTDQKHSDFGLPRNSHIKFRTATYESPKGTIVTSTDIENRRLSQLEQMHLRDQTKKPAVSAKPNRTPEKPKQSSGSSKIPVFNQKSLSSDNLTDKRYSLPRPQSHSSENILADLDKTDSGKK